MSEMEALEGGLETRRVKATQNQGNALMHWRCSLDGQRFRVCVVRGNKKLKIEPNASQAVSHDETRRRRGLTVWRGRVPSITGEDFVPFRVGIVLFLDKGIAGSRPSSGQEVPKVGSRMTVNGAEVLRYSQSRTRRARQAQEHAHGGRSLSNSNRCLASSTGKGF